MARQLEEVNTSGELVDLKLGGVGPDDSVTKKEYVDSALATKQDESALSSDVNAIMGSGSVPAINIGGIDPGHAALTLNDTTTQKFMKWMGQWVQQTYNIYEVVRDGAWLMIANKETAQRPSPQPTGESLTEYPAVVPDFSQANFTGVVWSGHDYTLLKDGWIQKLEIQVPVVDANTAYRVLIINLDDPANPIGQVVSVPILTPNEWVTVQALMATIPEGSKRRFVIEALTTSGTTELTGRWRFDGLHGGNSPAAQGWNRNNAGEILRIDVTDLDSVDRETELLAMPAGTVVQFVDSFNSANSQTFHIDAAGTLNGTTVIFQVSLIQQLGTMVTNVNCLMTATMPIAAPTLYETELGYWGTQTPNDWCSVAGYLSRDGVPIASPNDAFGVRVTFQEADVSEDWDMLSTTGDAGGSGTVVGSESLPQYLTVKATNIPITAIADPGDEVISLVTPALDPGKYTIGYAWQGTFDSKDKSIFYKVTGTNEDALWNSDEAPVAAQHRTKMYGYPFDWGGGVFTAGISFYMESNFGFTVDYIDLVIQRVD